MFKVENVNPFIDQTVNKLNDFCGAVNVQKKDMELLEKNFETFGRQVGLGVSGDLRGNYMFEFRESDLACKIATGMAGMEFSEWDEFVGSAVKEFVNIVAGNALITLQEKGKECDISTPTMREGKFTTNLSDPALRIVYEVTGFSENKKKTEIAIIISLI